MDRAAIEQRLQASVHGSLHLLLFDNARFLGERLVALNPSETNVALLALCYIHCNQSYRSYHLLKSLQSPQSRYLFATCCMQLGKLNEAREALNKFGKKVPNGAAGHYLLGRANRLIGRFTDAKEQYSQALKLDPLLWSAYEELCMLGADDLASDVCASFATSAQLAHAAAAAPPAAAAAAAAPAAGAAPAFALFDPTAAAAGGPPQLGGSLNFTTPGGMGLFGAAAQQPPVNGQAALGSPSFTFTSTPSTGGSQHQQQQQVAPPRLLAPAAAAASALGEAAARAAAAGAPLFGDWATPAAAGAAGLFQGFVTPGTAVAAATGMAAPHPAFPMAFGGQPVPGYSGAVAPDRVAAAGGTSAAAAGGAPGAMFETPLAAGAPSRPPDPPHKAEGAAFVPGVGGAKHGAKATRYSGRAAAAAASAATAGPSTSVADFTAPAVAGGPPTPTVGGSGSIDGSVATTSPGGGVGGRGKAGRKVSGRLFQEPSRRSTRLAAKDPGSSLHTAQGLGSVSTAPRPAATPGAPIPAKLGAMGQQADVKPIVLDGGRHQQLSAPGAAPPGGQGPGTFAFGVGTGAQHQTAAWLGGAGPAFGALSTLHQALVQTGLVQGLLLPLYEGFRHLCMYRCAEALTAFARLDKQQHSTAWVMCQIGRALFERMDYPAAAKAFESARMLDRNHVAGMDLYSTVLWHLRKECELSYLAQEMLAIDRLAPQAWCVLGNFCSLQKEHDAAVELFQRAVQLDPAFAYAYTLSGHEYFANEDYEKSLACYRTAVRLDPRHYNAMYGMGQIYLRQEKLDMALVHFKSAANINPSSSVLHCYIAMTLHRQGMHDKALSKLQDAITLDPKNPLARFEKASVLITMEQHERALHELQQLARLSPGEPSVYFQMGKLYKKLGDLERAQQQLEIALSFKSSSSDASLIKSAIEKLGLNDDDDCEEL